MNNSIPMAAITRLMNAEAALIEMSNSILTETIATKVEDEGKNIIREIDSLKVRIHQLHCEWEADRNAG